MAINGRGRPTKAQAAETAKVDSWMDCINEYERTFEKWQRRTETILKRYRDEHRNGAGTADTSAKFNILWSNVQTLTPATFSRLPQPDVSRRFRDNDPVGRVAALILERALDFEVQHYPDYRATMKSSVMDRFLGGRGTSWVRYEPHIRAVQVGEPAEGVEVSEDEDPDADAAQEELANESAPTDYVHWKDFGHSVARTWEEVSRVWRFVYLTRAKCIERFGEDLGKRIPLDSTPALQPGQYQAQGEEDKKRACVIEGWDKHTKTAIWLSKSLNEVLDEKPDPLELEGFFPCPRPLYSTLTNDSLVPVPDFALYQDQANTLDVLCDRIDGLCRMLQVKGVFDGSVKELGRLFTEGGNGNLIAIKNWAAFSDKNGLKGAIDVYDITPIFNALREAYGAMEQQKQQVYEITGISDIVRGQTQASETLGAQEIKKNFVGLRLGSYKEEVALYATDILRLKAQVICTKFDPMTIAKMAAVDQLDPADQQHILPAIKLLKNEPLRNFRVDIAADTLVQMDEAQEQEARVNFLAATGSFLTKAIEGLAQAGPAAPALAPLVMDLLKFGVTGFKVGKQIEGSIDAAIDQIKKIASQPPEPRPDPEMEKVKADAQAEQAKLQQEGQLDAQRNAQEQARADNEMRQKAQLSAMEQMMSQRFAEMTAQQDAVFKRWEAMLQAKTKVEIAQIDAAASVEVAKHAPKPAAGGE